MRLRRETVPHPRQRMVHPQRRNKAHDLGQEIFVGSRMEQLFLRESSLFTHVLAASKSIGACNLFDTSVRRVWDGVSEHNGE